MKILKNVTLMALFFIAVSCSKDLDNISENTLNPVDSVELKDGILVFSSKDFLIRKVDEIKDMKQEQKEQFLYKFYNQGFKPLFPRYRDDDNTKLGEFAQRKKERLSKLVYGDNQMLGGKRVPTEIDEDGELVEEFDDDLISDDDFASVLNDQREVIVGDSLYKFTYEGLFSVKTADKPLLDTYIEDNNIEYLVEANESIIRGEIMVTPDIKKQVPTVQDLQYVNNCHDNPSIDAAPDYSISEYLEDGPCNDYGGGGSYGGGSSGGGSSGGSNPPPTDHTASLVAFVQNLEACKTINGFLDSGFGIFGVSKKCYDNFSSKYRTKTKYYKENYLIYNAIGVKVKHQKKGWTGLWRAKSTNEVALMISQASFKYTINIPNFPSIYAPPKFYFFENKIFNSQGQLQNYANAIYKPPFPEVPFVSEVTVTEFINHATGADLSVSDLRENFYAGTWQIAKAIVNSQKGRDPKNVTHILYSPTKVYLTYIDLENRKLNTKKITKVFDWNFGIGFKFNVNIDGQGNLSTDLISDFGFDKIKIPKLYDYDDVKIDFVGVTRRGDTWKGSRLVYKDE
ncbi:hypothetical protein [Winogradskyella sp.]|uniref:hypothetical protein n=1 Tax=Winogradskyella sp. TaxID=1883156 RepID=UPI00261CE680|nr:hypothetical protein [Winogradskyella sp.]